jgi:hypothetical protein
MGKAFEDVIEALGIEPGDETRREAVARFIFHLAEVDGGQDASIMRKKAVLALAGSIGVKTGV